MGLMVFVMVWVELGTSRPLAAVVGEVSQQFVHSRKRCAVDQVAPLTLLADEA